VFAVVHHKSLGNFVYNTPMGYGVFILFSLYWICFSGSEEVLNMNISEERK